MRLSTSIVLLCFFLVPMVTFARTAIGSKRNAVVLKDLSISPSEVFEDSALTYTFNINFSFLKPFKGDAVFGNNTWSVTIWLSRRKTGERKSFGMTSAVLTNQQAAQALQIGDMELRFKDVNVHLDLSKTSCETDLLYLCARLSTTSPELQLKDLGRKFRCVPVTRCVECQNQGCTREFAPVCGSDGVTYSNQCVLNDQRCLHPELVAVYEGKCVDEDCKQCPEFQTGVKCMTTNPRCPAEGCADGQACCRHPCGATCTPIGQECAGVCPEYGFLLLIEPKRDTCAPGCAEGTYCCDFGAGARCMAGDGPTDDACENHICPLFYSPVCGSDGKTYGNICNLGWQQRCEDEDLTVAYEGQCVKDCKQCPEYPNILCILPNPKCPAEGCPEGQVCCGHSCGATCTPIKKDCEVCPDYNSSRILDPNRTIVSCAFGCGTESYCCDDGTGARCLNKDGVDCRDRFCTEEYSPICGSDGNTYGNTCKFDIAVQCINAQLTKAYDGECERLI